MPVVCDFELIVGDAPITIGDGNTPWQATFGTGGREAGSPGFLIFNVRHLTHADRDVVVSLNGQEVGRIHNYFPGGNGVNKNDINDPAKWRQADHYYTQMIAFQGTSIRDGNNTIQIQAVEFPGNTDTNVFDDFYIKDLVCFFHQSA